MAELCFRHPIHDGGMTWPPFTISNLTTAHLNTQISISICVYIYACIFMYMVLPLTQKPCPKLMTTRWQKVGFEVGGIYCIHIYIYYTQWVHILYPYFDFFVEKHDITIKASSYWQGRKGWPWTDWLMDTLQVGYRYGSNWKGGSCVLCSI